jgi:RNA recognition motif-containing protein
MWRQPVLLPIRTDITWPTMNSTEKLIQSQRHATVSPVSYFSESDVPENPFPLSDIEVALDLTAQSSAKTTSFPFFVPQVQAAASDVSYTAPPASYYDVNNTSTSQSAMDTSYMQSNSTLATPEYVQALGLPLFLAGQNRQALDTLASSPGLLATLVDAKGMYDQHRLLTLVQTLSNSHPVGVQQTHPQPYVPAPVAYSAPVSAYNPASPYGVPTPSFQAAPLAKSGYRGGSSDGNLHVSGYGPSTTEADIINLFAPYVQVDEVVMKGTFAFVNTSDPINANIAKEALAGTLLGGMPIRINPAQRKNRDASASLTGRPAAVSNSTYGVPVQAPTAYNAAVPYGNVQPYQAVPSMAGMPPTMPGPPGAQQGTMMGGMLNSVTDVEAVRDDRGNPATKNLFVAGFGPGTTESQLRDMFSQRGHVIGVVLKGSFAFVNTSDKSQAVLAREALSGVHVNGAPLRINFAKETGRLGTSFDLTYNAGSGPNAMKPAPATSSNLSYYGRGF